MICACLECGRSFETRVNRAQRFCSPEPGRNMSACAQAYNSRVRFARPEVKAQKVLQQRAWRKKVSASPELSERNRVYKRRYWRENPDKVRAWRKRYMDARRVVDQPSGSVLVASSPRAEGRDILVELLRLVPRTLGAQTREEVVAEAALMVMEGTTVEGAAREALRQVRRSEAPYYGTRQIELCEWL